MKYINSGKYTVQELADEFVKTWLDPETEQVALDLGLALAEIFVDLRDGHITLRKEDKPCPVEKR